MGPDQCHAKSLHVYIIYCWYINNEILWLWRNYIYSFLCTHLTSCRSLVDRCSADLPGAGLTHTRKRGENVDWRIVCLMKEIIFHCAEETENVRHFWIIQKIALLHIVECNVVPTRRFSSNDIENRHSLEKGSCKWGLVSYPYHYLRCVLKHTHTHVCYPCCAKCNWASCQSCFFKKSESVRVSLV